MDSKTLEPQTALAYGAIYLDTGEDVEAMTKKQLDSFREQLPKFVFFDIICKKDQIDMAMAARGYVQQEAKAELELGDVGVYVAIGFSENDRPARAAMMEYAQK